MREVDRYSVTRLFAGVEAHLQLFLDFPQGGVELPYAGFDLLLFVAEQLEALLVPGQFFLHVAHRLAQQDVGFLYAVEDCVQVGPEQARDAGDQCHGVCLLSCWGGSSLGGVPAAKQTQFGKTSARRFTKHLHARNRST